MRYTLVKFQPGLFRKPKVYKVLYTLNAFALAETYLGIDLTEINTLPHTKQALARLLWCGLLDAQPAVTIKEASKLIGFNKEAVFRALATAISKALPKIEATNEEKIAEAEPGLHWRLWSEFGAMLQISPIELQNYTPSELYERVQAFNKQQKHYQQLLAWHACIVINCFSKKRVTVSQLMGEDDNHEEISDEDFDKVWKQRQEHQKQCSAS